MCKCPECGLAQTVGAIVSCPTVITQHRHQPGLITPIGKLVSERASADALGSRFAGLNLCPITSRWDWNVEFEAGVFQGRPETRGLIGQARFLLQTCTTK